MSGRCSVLASKRQRGFPVPSIPVLVPASSILPSVPNPASGQVSSLPVISRDPPKRSDTDAKRRV